MFTFNSPTRKEIAVQFITSLMERIGSDKMDCAKAVSVSAENFMYYGVSMIKNDTKYTLLSCLKRSVERTIYDNNVPATLKNFLSTLTECQVKEVADPFKRIYSAAGNEAKEDLAKQLAPLTEMFENSTIIEITV